MGQLDAAHKARVALVEREFPEWAGKEWKLWQSGSKAWGVVPPSNNGMTTTCPPGWKFEKRGPACSPLQRDKKGRKLAVEMREQKYRVPSNSDFASALGIEATLQAVDDGMCLFTVGVQAPRAGVYVITLHHEQKPPSDCVRITDVEFEAMGKKKRAGAS